MVCWVRDPLLFQWSLMTTGPSSVALSADDFPISSVAMTTPNCSESAEAAAWNLHLQSQLDTGKLIDRAVTPIWYVVGIVGNVLSTLIWLQRRMRRNNSSAVYLAALSINDTLFLLLHIILDLNIAWDVQTLDYPVVCETFSLVYLVTQYLAPMLVLGFTVERFIAVCYPYQVSYLLCPAPRVGALSDDPRLTSVCLTSDVCLFFVCVHI